MIVWALFDDGEGSWRNLNQENILSIGIRDNDWENYYKIDLSLTNPNLFKELDKLPRPDVIVASPPCESWSIADCGGVMYNSDLTLKNKNYYDEYNLKAKPNKKRYFINKEINRIMGINTIGATLAIIEHYKPRVWIIENPQTSYIWKFIDNHWNFKGIKNLAYYSNYDSSYSHKPTIFFSNKNLNLKADRSVERNKEYMLYCAYDKRSSIPKKLLQEILWWIKNN